MCRGGPRVPGRRRRGLVWGSGPRVLCCQRCHSRCNSRFGTSLHPLRPEFRKVNCLGSLPIPVVRPENPAKGGEEVVGVGGVKFQVQVSTSSKDGRLSGLNGDLIRFTVETFCVNVIANVLQ